MLEKTSMEDWRLGTYFQIREKDAEFDTKLKKIPVINPDFLSKDIYKLLKESFDFAKKDATFEKIQRVQKYNVAEMVEKKTPTESPSREEQKAILYLEKTAIRVENIFNSEIITDEQIEEAGQIHEKIEEYHEKFWENEKVQKLLWSIHDKFEKILKKKEQQKNLQKTHDIAINEENTLDSMVTLTPMEEWFYEDFDEAIAFFTSQITYNISSTKRKSDSFGDGSFSMKIFRPVMVQIKTLLDDKKIRIPSQGISWADIAHVHEQNIEDMDRARNLFLWVLKKNTKPATRVSDLFTFLYESLEEVAEYNYLGEHKWQTALKVFLEEYEKNLQEFFQK